jgi:hypothetical protein
LAKEPTLVTSARALKWVTQSAERPAFWDRELERMANDASETVSEDAKLRRNCARR